MRDPIDVLRLVFLGGCVWFAATGDVKGLVNLVVAAIGVLVARAGQALLVCWTRFGWGSVRRIPGENRFEDTDA